MQSPITPLVDITLPNQMPSLLWQSAHGWKPPRQVIETSDGISADQAYRAVSQGTGIWWQSDYHQARQLLAALKRRLERNTPSFEGVELPDRFHRIRLRRAQTARQSGLLLIEVKPGYRIELPRAPDAQAALEMAYGESLRAQNFVMPLTEFTGVLSAFEWHQKGLPVAALGHSIYPRWGVFAPTRHEYLDLIMRAELPNPVRLAVDVGTGTGVLSLLLAKRGISRIIATDTHPQAVACAKDNINRAGLNTKISIQATDLMPNEAFDLIVCNPPWLPGAASGPLEAAVYDPDHRMLRGFLKMAGQHLSSHGQAWLILSDLAEHLKLRSREQLLSWITEAGLVVINRLDAKPTHRKLANTTDPLAEFRRAEITSVWQLQAFS